MSVPDHDAIFVIDSLRAPTLEGLLGQWQAYRVWVNYPDESLHNQFNLPSFRLRFEVIHGSLSARVQFAKVFTSHRGVTIENGLVRMDSSADQHDEIRQIDENTLLGRRVRRRNGNISVTKRYVLSRVETD
jgi:hypothetical protein